MEAQERNSLENASKSRGSSPTTHNPDVSVDPGTISTAEASPPAGGAAMQDASVISAITDHASLEGAVLHPLPAEGASLPTTQGHPEVPKQVILPEEGRPEAAAVAQTGTLTNTPGIAVSPTTTTPPPPPPPAVAMPDSQSTSALPDPPKALALERNSDPTNRLHSRSSSTEDVRAASTPVTGETKLSLDAQVDDYIRSPEVQNAIVERSPGGRYVRFMEKLGSGASKDVYRAYDTQEGIEVAWNVVTLSGVPRMERNRIINEVRLLERLHHQNIISFHGSWVNRERQEINFVTEILSSGTLKSFINKVQVIRWKIAKRWAVQILNGLAYLHAQDPPVIHRDLKCENIFINGTSGDLRIGDLGLSTVHRNGKVLSVLGTPEFMAPDMYEEAPYDEKVDIYAFGMCMLEIFTKEIPYSECKNPAQIYKKVSAGEPPEVLTRLESRHARDFVMLCLGTRDENGRYIRPSADELLKHPFLDKRSTDDDEVIVERPLRERVIPEATESSSTSPNGISQRYANGAGSPPYGTSGTSPPQGASDSNGNGKSSEFRESESINSARNRMASTNSLEDDGNDHFDDMPESESNMKKVKVLIGRGQVLKEDDSESQNTGGVLSSTLETPAAAAAQPPAHNYLVAAAVIENENLHVKPYADDILKLVVTLPVEGQTQNVQFDFHLVRDDPVQVAKEMVQELGIPQGAVLEISETISGLACSARMKQDSHNLKLQQENAIPGPAPAALPQPAAQPPTDQAPAAMSDSQPVASAPAPQGPLHGQVYTAPAAGQPPVHGVHPQQGQPMPQAPPPSHAVPAAHPGLTDAVPVPVAQVPSEAPLTDLPPQQVYANPPLHAQSPHSANATSPRPENRKVTAAAGAARIPVPFAGNAPVAPVERVVSVGTVEGSVDLPVASPDALGLSDEDEDIQAELRKLEEEYERNLERAKKVFDSRMVNLQRSQKEKEKEHQKFLEKHEKERAEFEKRRALEEEQQQRRLEQIQKERDRKIQSLALEKKKILIHASGSDNLAEATEAANRELDKEAVVPLPVATSLAQAESSTNSWNQSQANASLTQSERSVNSWNPAVAAMAQSERSTTSWNSAAAPLLPEAEDLQQQPPQQQPTYLTQNGLR